MRLSLSSLHLLVLNIFLSISNTDEKLQVHYYRKMNTESIGSTDAASTPRGDKDEDDNTDDAAANTPTATAFGAYFAILPAHPSISPSQLLQVCQDFCQQEEFPQVEWLYHRTAQLQHPQLTQPLPFLEVSGKVFADNNNDSAAESTCHDIVQALNTRYSSVIGNAELLLLLPNTPIPLLDMTLPLIRILDMDDSDACCTCTISMIRRAKDHFETHGVVAISPAIRRQGQDDVNEDSNVNVIWDELLEYTLNIFDRLYAQLQTKPKSYNKKQHYKEIMQRDEHRFDFRLDIDPITNNPSRDNSDADSTTLTLCCWQRLERSSNWINVVHDILGADAVRIKTGCVLSLPGAGEQYWHSDGIHVGPAASFESLPSSSLLEKEEQTSGAGSECAPPHAICVFVPLVNLTMQTGYTEFWSGSHKFDKLLSKKGEQALPGGTLGLLNVGDVLLYDYRVVHRGMPNHNQRQHGNGNDDNNNTTAARPIIYYLYTKPGYETIEDQNFTEDSVWA